MKLCRFGAPQRHSTLRAKLTDFKVLLLLLQYKAYISFSVFRVVVPAGKWSFKATACLPKSSLCLGTASSERHIMDDLKEKVFLFCFCAEYTR